MYIYIYIYIYLYILYIYIYILYPSVDYAREILIVIRSNPFRSVGELLNGQGIQDEMCASHACNFLESVFALFTDDSRQGKVVSLPTKQQFTMEYFLRA